MKVTDDEDVVGTSPDSVDIVMVTSPDKLECYIEEQNHSSSDEAEFSSSSSSSEKDFPLQTTTGKINTKNESDNIKSKEIDIERSTDVSDFGYDSSTSSGNDLDLDEEFKYLPKDLKILIEGLSRGLPIIPQDEKPKWLDMEKFKIGQEFATKYYFGVNFAEMLSLLILFTFNDSFKPLMFTDQSGTPLTSFKRYLSTVLRVKTWFENDVFEKDNPGYNNIKIVRCMHSSVCKKMNSLSTEEVNNRITELNNSKNLVSTSKNSITEDFQNSLCPFIHQFSYPRRKKSLFFNQCSMSITQFGFIGLIISYPEKFGAGQATEAELEGFVHLWRVLGYLLGVEDKYNFCNGDLNDVRDRCKSLLNYWVIPNFTCLSTEWEHFSRCLVTGVSFYVPGNTFEISILYLCYVLNINARKFYSGTSWVTYFRYQFFKFTLCCALKLPWLLDLANRSLRRSLRRAKNFSAERLRNLEVISNQYMQL